MYAREKFEMAVYQLATGRGEIKGRLMEAFNEIVPLTEKDIPKELVDDYRWIVSELTKNPPKIIKILRDGKVHEESTGRVGATVPFMRINKAIEVA